MSRRSSVRRLRIRPEFRQRRRLTTTGQLTEFLTQNAHAERDGPIIKDLQDGSQICLLLDLIVLPMGWLLEPTPLVRRHVGLLRHASGSIGGRTAGTTIDFRSLPDLTPTHLMRESLRLFE